MVDAKVILGDSRHMDEVGDCSVQLVITSPPYYDLKTYATSETNIASQVGSPKNFEKYLSDLGEVFDECIRVLGPDGKLAINIMPIFLSGEETGIGRRSTKTMISEIENLVTRHDNMYVFALYLWDKRKFARFSSFGSYPFPPNIFSTMPYEWIIVFSKVGKRAKVAADIKERSRISNEEWQRWAINSIWEMSPAKATSEGHPAPFPEELPKRLIKLYSFAGDTVLDPFGGSGTTALAALNLDRNAIVYEISEQYVELAKKKITKAKPSTNRD